MQSLLIYLDKFYNYGFYKNCHKNDYKDLMINSSYLICKTLEWINKEITWCMRWFIKKYSSIILDEILY